MKKNLVLLMLCAFGLSTLAQNPLITVDHSVFADEVSLIDVYGFGVPTDYPAGHRTFRLYGYLDDANSVMQSVIGVPGGLEAYIGTDTPDGNLWNYPGNGVTTAAQIPNAFVPFTGDGGTWMYDSYVTIGSENDSWSGGVNNGAGSQGDLTFGIGESNVPVSVYWGDATYSDIGNPDFIMTNEAWLLGDVTSINAFGVGPDFQVLLAQLTTIADDIHYGLNITALTDVPLSGGETWITYHDASGLGGTTFMEADGTNMGLLYPNFVDGGCTDPNACNFDSVATEDDGSCSFGDWYLPDYCGDGGVMIQSCDDPGAGFTLAGDQDCAAQLAIDNSFCTETAFDGTCLDGYTDCSGDIQGCMDELACNFNSAATIDDCSCDFISCAGCMDSAACNFDSSATMDDGSCDFTSCAGCMDSAACNFDSSATIDDGSCEFNSCAGCMDSAACNFDSSATIDDGSCEFNSCAGCMDSTACNYDSNATIEDGSCEFTSCLGGCTDSTACNYDSTAVTDDGSCSFDNDEPACAEAIDPVSAIEDCVPTAVDLTGATSSLSSVNLGADRWYSFVAISSVVHVSLTNVEALDEGAILGLYDAGLEFITEGDFSFGNEDETLVAEGLIVGETYYIAVEESNTDPSTMIGDLCVIQYPGSACDLPPSLAAGPFTIQSQLKADYIASANGYRLTMKSTTTGISYTSPPQSSTWIYIVHSGAPNAADNYDVCLEACYTIQTQTGEIVVYVTRSSCNIDVDRFDTYLVGAHNCTNKTWPLSGRPKAAPPQVDAGSFTWEFTEIGTEITWEYTSPTGARKLPAGGLGALLEDNEGDNVIIEGTTYDVRIRANYNSGSFSEFGPSECLTVGGASSGEAANGPSDTDGTFAEAAKSLEDLYGEKLTIYPNPSNGDYLNLSISEVEDNKVLVDILDLQGRTIQSVQLPADIDAPFSQKITLDNLSSGIYVIRVTVGNSVTIAELSVVK